MECCVRDEVGGGGSSKLGERCEGCALRVDMSLFGANISKDKHAYGFFLSRKPQIHWRIGKGVTVFVDVLGSLGVVVDIVVLMGAHERLGVAVVVVVDVGVGHGLESTASGMCSREDYFDEVTGVVVTTKRQDP